MWPSQAAPADSTMAVARCGPARQYRQNLQGLYQGVAQPGSTGRLYKTPHIPPPPPPRYSLLLCRTGGQTQEPTPQGHLDRFGPGPAPPSGYPASAYPAPVSSGYPAPVSNSVLELRMCELASPRLQEVVEGIKAQLGGVLAVGLQRHCMHLPTLRGRAGVGCSRR